MPADDRSAATTSQRERDLATVRRALQFYADDANWHQDDWGVQAVIVPPDYGVAGRRARQALPAMRRLIEDAYA